MGLIQGWRNVRRTRSAFAEAVALQRRTSALTWQKYRSVGGLIAALGTIGMIILTEWDGGFFLVGAALLVMLDSEGHRTGSVTSRPLFSLLLDTIFMAFCFGFLGISGVSLGLPFAYVIAAATLLLRPAQGLAAVAFALVVFGLVPGMDFPMRSPFPPASTQWLGLAVTLLFGVFLVMLVWPVFDGLIRESTRQRRSVAYQKALAECSQVLLAQNENEAMTKACRALLPATQADYIFVEEVVEGADGRPQTNIIASAEAHEDRERGDQPYYGGPIDATPTSTAALVEGQSIVIQTRDLTGDERRIYEMDGIKTEILVPIMHEGSWVGTVGFIDYQMERHWEQPEIDAIETAAGLFSSFHARTSTHRRLLESLESKDQFIASVSHELRTPLTAVMGLSKELEDRLDSFDQDELIEFVSIIARQSSEVSSIVEDLLVSARAEAGILTVRAEKVDPRQVIADLVGREELLGIDGAGVEIVGNAPHAWADPLRVRQIVRNLLTNASRYGGNDVWIELASHHDGASIRVCDNGSGVGGADYDRIFEPYASAHQHAGMPASVGLGLSVARQLARLMGGDVRFVPGPHTIFELTLPGAAIGTLVPASVG